MVFVENRCERASHSGHRRYSRFPLPQAQGASCRTSVRGRLFRCKDPRGCTRRLELERPDNGSLFHNVRKNFALVVVPGFLLLVIIFLVIYGQCEGRTARIDGTWCAPRPSARGGEIGSRGECALSTLCPSRTCRFKSGPRTPLYFLIYAGRNSQRATIRSNSET